MERWQKSHLRGNISKLANSTTCSEKLLLSLVSDGVLLNGDIDKIKCQEDRSKKAEVLYESVETRKTGYFSLAKSLKECKQTEAFDILLEGFTKNGLASLHVNITGVVKPLKDFLDDFDVEPILQNLQSNLSQKQQLDIFLKCHDTMNLTHDTMPQKYPSYIPRILSRRGQTFSEDEFIDSVAQGRGSRVCISDYPGNGKTYLLANLARGLSHRHPERLIVFIQLPHFIEYLARQGKVAEMDSSSVRKCILKYVSVSQAAFHILDEIMSRGNVAMEIFLDGFNEVIPKHSAFAKIVLKQISTNLPNTNIYTACTLQMQDEFETAYKFSPYEIIPFDENQEILLLTTIWHHANPKSDEAKLDDFALHILQKLKNSITAREPAGTPLKCRVLADAYALQASNYATSEQITFIEEFPDFPTTLAQLYQKYMDHRFSQFSNPSDMQIAKKYHVLTALKTLFPEIAEELSLSFAIKKTTDELNAFVQAAGLLEHHSTGVGDILNFLHSTFAEYLAAEYFVSTIYPPSKEGWTEVFQKKIVKFLFETVLMVRDNLDGVLEKEKHAVIFCHPTILYFLNFHFETTNIETFKKTTLEMFVASVTPERLFSILLGFLRNNLGNIFKIFKNLLASIPKPNLKKYADHFSQEDNKRLITLLNEAAKHSDVSLVDSLFTLSRDHFNCDLVPICQEFPPQTLTPIHFAIQRENLQVVDYFADKISLQDRCLIYQCIEWSAADPVPVVEKKIDICTLLLEKNFDLLREPKYFTSTRKIDGPLVAEEVHLKLIKFLIQQGADPRTTIWDRKTVVHRSADYMPARDLHELCRFLIQEWEATDLFKRSRQKWHSPVHYILRVAKDLQPITIQMILEGAGVNVNDKDEHGDTMIFAAVAGNQSKDVIRTLIEHEG